MISDRIFVEAQLARLSACYPTFRMVGPTQELYVQKLSKLDADDLGSAVEFFIEHGKRYPTIGQLLDRAMSSGAERVKRRRGERQVEQGRRDRLEMPNWGARFDSPMFREAFERGRQRMLNRKPGEPCPCMDCQFKRCEGTLGDGGPVEPHIRAAHEKRIAEKAESS